MLIFKLIREVKNDQGSNTIFMDTDFLSKYQLSAKICQAPLITIPRNAEIEQYF